MHRVLVALDDSDASERAATFAKEFFRDLEKVEILGIRVARDPHPWVPPMAPFGVAYPWAPDLIEQAREQAVQSAERTLETSGLDADEDLVELGNPAEAVANAAVEHDVDLIVLGTKKKGFFKRLHEGSVSRVLTRASPRPVLLVH